MVTLRGGHADIGRLLLERGADANAKDSKKHIPIHVVSKGGHVEFARVLLEHGANTKARSPKNTTHWIGRREWDM